MNKKTEEIKKKNKTTQTKMNCAVRDATESKLSNSLAEMFQQCALSQNKSTDDTKHTREMGKSNENNTQQTQMK